LCSNKLNTMSLDDLDDFENLDFASVLLNNFGVEPFSSGTDHIIGSSLPQSISTSGESRSQEDADCSGETCVKGPATTKATREKLRRERLNERFAELSKLLNLEGANVDKLRMLSAAVDELKALREEVTMLKSTNSRLHMANTMTSKMAVSLLKSQNGAYVTEEVDDRAVKRQRSESSEAYAQFNAQQQQHILQHPNALAFNLGGMGTPAFTPAPAQSQAAFSDQNRQVALPVKMENQSGQSMPACSMMNSMKVAMTTGVPVNNFPQPSWMMPGPVMWQNIPMSMWMPPSAQDTSQDHLLRPPVA